MDYSSGFSQGDGPRFFKVILEATIRQEKLKLPKKFVRRYGNNMPSNVTLEIPSGGTWQVELLKKNTEKGELWFEKGWKEFAEQLCLEHGHAVFFKYNLASHFHVIICDKSGLEIDYQGNNMEGDEDYLQYLNALNSAEGGGDEAYSEYLNALEL